MFATTEAEKVLDDTRGASGLICGGSHRVDHEAPGAHCELEK